MTVYVNRFGFAYQRRKKIREMLPALFLIIAVFLACGVAGWVDGSAREVVCGR